MTDFPRSLMEFQQRFPDEDRRLRPKAHTHDCADCRKQASVTAGTVMHGYKLVLTAWFWTAHLMATHSNGISALQLQKQLCLGSYKTAWLLATKVRRAMGAPRRMPLAGLVEVDESLIASPSKDNPPSGGGRRSRQGKLLVADAVEVGEGGSDRIRLAQLEDFSADSLHAFLGVNLATGAIARTDGWAGYPDESGVIHDPHIGGNMAPISSCSGFIASSPTSRPVRWTSTAASDASACNPTSTSSSSVSAGATTPVTPPSAPSSALAS